MILYLIIYLCPSKRNFPSCNCKFAADIERIRVLAPEDSLRCLEGLLEGGRDFDQLISRYAFVKRKSPSVTPLEGEREIMIRSKNALGQCHLVVDEGPGFGEFAGVDERR